MSPSFSSLRQRRGRSIRIAGAAAALLTVAMLGVPAPAVAAEEATLLDGVTGVGDVAAGGGRVFVAAVDRVVVADAEGAVTDSVTGLAGAVGLALSTDADRLYVALRDSGEEAEIDTATLAVTRRIDVGRECPTNLAIAGSRLWIGYGCDQWGGGVVTVDAAATPANVFGVADNMYGAPLVAVGGGVLAIGEAGLSPAYFRVYAVNGEDATLRGSIGGDASNLGDLAVTPDGGQVIAASGAPYTPIGYDTTTLAEVRRYGDIAPYPNAAEISPDGRFLAAGRNGSPDVSIHAIGDGALVNHADNPAGDLVPGNLAFLGTDVFAVLNDWSSGRFYLWRIAGATLPTSALTLTAPESATALQPMTITGRLTVSDGAAPGAQQLGVTRTLPDGTTATLAATTAADGTFTITDTPPVSGEIRYDVTWDGNATYRGSSASTTVTVAARTATLTLTGPTTGADGARLRLSGTLTLDGKAPGTPQTLAVSKTIWNNRLGGVTEQLPAVTTDNRGAFRFVDTPTQGGRYVYTVRWDVGSAVYAPASATHEVTVSSTDSQVTGLVEQPGFVCELFRGAGGISYDIGDCQGPTTIHVTRRIGDGAAEQRPDVTTNASCSFGFDDVLSQPASVSYTLTWDGNAGHRGSSVTVTGTVGKQPSYVEATAQDYTLQNGERAIIDGKVAGSRTGSIGARLTLTVNRIGPDGTVVALRNVTTATDGTFSFRDAPPKVDASTYPQFQYEISWAGNATYEASSTSVFVYIVPAG